MFLLVIQVLAEYDSTDERSTEDEEDEQKSVYNVGHQHPLPAPSGVSFVQRVVLTHAVQNHQNPSEIIVHRRRFSCFLCFYCFPHGVFVVVLAAAATFWELVVNIHTERWVVPLNIVAWRGVPYASVLKIRNIPLFIPDSKDHRIDTEIHRHFPSRTEGLSVVGHGEIKHMHVLYTSHIIREKRTIQCVSWLMLYQYFGSLKLYII